MFRTRNKRLPLISAAFGILLSMLMCCAHAGDIEKAEYDKGFGARDAAVRASRSPRKIAEFAGELLESAKLVREDQPYQAYLFNKSYEIGMLFPEGIPFAVEAMDQLGNAQPQLKGVADANLLNAMQKRYLTSGGPQRISAASAYIDRALQIADSLAAEGKYDEAVIICDKAKIALAASAARHNDVLERALMFKEEQTAAKRIATLKAALKTTPHDAVAAGELVHLLMLDTDTPDQALPYVDATGDAKLKRIVALAAKDVATLTDIESLELADWYRGRTNKAGKSASYTAWSRAKLCYQRFLDAHPKSDADRLNATRAMKDAEVALEKSPHPIGLTRTREDRPAQTAGNVASNERPAPPVGNIPGNERVVLFDGGDLSKWRRQGGGPPGFAIVNASLEARVGDIQTVEAFEDFHLHLEFATSDSPPGAIGQARSNSGVFLQGRYEIQILDSFGVGNFGNGDCGAIWGQLAPTRNVSKPPGQWQTYDIEFHAAKFAGGSKTTPARLTLVWNGENVLDNVVINGTTLLGDPEAATPGPIRLQYKAAPVHFRNIWLERIAAAGVVRPPSGRGETPAARPGTASDAEVATYLQKLGIEFDAREAPDGKPLRHFTFHESVPVTEWPMLLMAMKDAEEVVFRSRTFSETAAEGLPSLKSLKSLHINHNIVSDVAFSYIAKCSSLESLDIGLCNVGDSGMKALAKGTKITFLGLHNAGPTLITDVGFGYVAQMQTLQGLDATNSGMTDQGLATVGGLPALRTLNVSGSKTTPQGRIDFRKKHSGVDVGAAY